MHCSSCGQKALETAKFCQACGARLSQLEPRSSDASRQPDNVPPALATQASEASTDSDSESPQRCPRCGLPWSPSTGSLCDCGYNFLTEEGGSTTSLAFTGKATEVFSVEFLKSMLWAISIVGLPVAIVIWWRWWIRHISLPDGTTLSFLGTVKRSYLLFLLGILATLPQDAAEAFFTSELLDNLPAAWMNVLLVALAVLGWVLGGFVLPALVQREYFKWWCQETQFSTGERLMFTGRPWPQVGWYAAGVFSMLTIVGWAWVGRAYAQWICTNVCSPGRVFRFTGRGAEILWRGLVTAVACCGILTFPWGIVWFNRWVYQHVEVDMTSEPA